jgi:hypothetical protein
MSPRTAASRLRNLVSHLSAPGAAAESVAQRVIAEKEKLTVRRKRRRFGALMLTGVRTV